MFFVWKKRKKKHPYKNTNYKKKVKKCYSLGRANKTEGKITSNHPDIIIKDVRDITTTITDLTDIFPSRKAEEKFFFLKLKLGADRQRMRVTWTGIVPAITVALGTMKTSGIFPRTFVWMNYKGWGWRLISGKKTTIGTSPYSDSPNIVRKKKKEKKQSVDFNKETEILYMSYREKNNLCKHKY